MTPPMNTFNDPSSSHLTTKNDAFYQFSTTTTLTQTTLPLFNKNPEFLIRLENINLCAHHALVMNI